MSDPHRAERYHDLAQGRRRWSSVPSNGGRGSFDGPGAATNAALSQTYLPQVSECPVPRKRGGIELRRLLRQERLIKFSSLCGIAFSVGAGAALYLENSRFLTAEAMAAGENRPQVVNRSQKGDRLSASTIDSSPRSAEPQDGFGTLEVGGTPNATITIRDPKGRLMFELDPLRRTTVISKRDARGAPSLKEQSGQKAPKSGVAPVEWPAECDPPRWRLAGSPLSQSVEDHHPRAQGEAKRQESL
jgi:hypothetical protein